MFKFKITDSYCMGGTGMILSRAALKKLAQDPSNIANCSRNTVTTHEDIEIGRCIRDSLRVNCLYSLQTSVKFYNNYFKESKMMNDYKHFHFLRKKHFSVHALKNPKNMIAMHERVKRVDHLELEKTANDVVKEYYLYGKPSFLVNSSYWRLIADQKVTSLKSVQDINGLYKLLIYHKLVPRILISSSKKVNMIFKGSVHTKYKVGKI